MTEEIPLFETWLCGCVTVGHGKNEGGLGLRLVTVHTYTLHTVYIYMWVTYRLPSLIHGLTFKAHFKITYKIPHRSVRHPPFSVEPLIYGVVGYHRQQIMSPDRYLRPRGSHSLTHWTLAINMLGGEVQWHASSVGPEPGASSSSLLTLGLLWLCLWLSSDRTGERDVRQYRINVVNLNFKGST